MWQVSLFTFAKPLISCGVSDNEINEVKCSLSSIIPMMSEKYNITTVKNNGRHQQSDQPSCKPCHVLVL